MRKEDHGPNQGKTTVSVLKAARVVSESNGSHQKVLFLAFARATVNRITQSVSKVPDLDAATLHGIEVDTYHAFFWRLLKCHGYLLGLPRRLEILLPPAEAVALSPIRSNYSPSARREAETASALARQIATERHRLAKSGRVSFNLFAPYVAQLLRGSRKLLALVGRRYPCIILDEFQDTDPHQWRAVRELGRVAVPIALADPDQRIYDFIGADPKRLDQFREAFRPTEISLASANHRSGGTEIRLFADDVLHGRFTRQAYRGVLIRTFQPNKNQAHAAVLAAVQTARARLVKEHGTSWSLAVLVPTKRMTRTVSGFLSTSIAHMKPVIHSTVLDIEGIALAAEVLAVALEPAGVDRDGRFIASLCRFLRGRRGGDPNQGDMKTAENVERAYATYVKTQEQGKAARSNSLATKILAELNRSEASARTGNPERDWLTVRESLGRRDADKRVKLVAEEAKHLRLLGRGSELRSTLAEQWRETGDYRSALEVVRGALGQQHFASQQRPERGVVVMNMHKAKGKEFDEVLIFEGWPNYVHGELVSNQDRIVRSNRLEGDVDQARQNLRVSITRAKSCTTILTPQNDPCVFLSGAT